MPPLKAFTLMGSKLYMTPNKTEIISKRVIEKALPKMNPTLIATMALKIYNQESNSTASFLSLNNARYFIHFPHFDNLNVYKTD